MTNKPLKKFRVVDVELSQTEMAQKIGVSVKTYRRIETGFTRGSLNFWDSLQDVFNVTDDNIREMQRGRII